MKRSSNFSKLNAILATDPTTGEVAMYGSLDEAAAAVGVDKSGICRALKGKQSVAGGRTWRLVGRVLLMITPDSGNRVVAFNGDGDLVGYPNGEKLRGMNFIGARFYDLTDKIYAPDGGCELGELTASDGVEVRLYV